MERKKEMVLAVAEAATMVVLVAIIWLFIFPTCKCEACETCEMANLARGLMAAMVTLPVWKAIVRVLDYYF